MTTREYNQCVEAYADGLLRFAVSKVDGREDAEDIVQLVFERLWKKHQEVDMTTAKAYLYKSIHNACIDKYRQARIVPIHDELTLANVTHQAHDWENKQLIEEMLSLLTEAQRTLLLLRDYEGFSYKELSGMLNLTEAQVKINLFRIRKRLQKWAVDSNISIPCS